MSTLPTQVTDPTMIPETIAATQGAVDPTAATEAALDIASIKELMDKFDPAALLPELADIFGSIETICRVAIMIGPIILLILGLAYLLFSPREANYYFGYRCYFGMGSVQAWRFTQRLAGIVLGSLGLVLTGIMLFIGNSFSGMASMDVVWKSIHCLLWQGGLALVANLAIGIAAMVRFDRKGQYRKKA